jgi:hypothetical protein
LVNVVRLELVVSVCRLETFGGSRPSSRLLGVVVEGRDAEVLDLLVEVLLPQGFSGPWLFWSGGSAVVGADAVGSAPDRDITDEVDVQLSVRRRPHGRGAVLAGVMSDLVGDVDDQLVPVGQVVAPVGVIVDGLGDSG